jgi:hypothetical protein
MDTDHFSTWTRWEDKRRVFYIFTLVSEDGSEESLFWRKLDLTLWSDFTDEDISCFRIGTDTDDTIDIEILEFCLTDIWDIIGCLLRKLLNMEWLMKFW